MPYTRQMRLGFSIGSIGYHYGACRRRRLMAGSLGFTT